MAEKVNVTASNQKAFQTFKDKLSTVPTYISTSKKFGKWLGDAKAYYLEARPWIVEILMTAEGTLRTHGPALGDQYPKIASAFVDLVSAIEPFQGHFVEPDLHASVRHLLETAAHLQALPLPVPVQVSIEPSQQMRPSSSSLAAALTPVESPTSRVPSVPPPPTALASVASPATSIAPETAQVVPAPPEAAPAPAVKPKRKTKKKNISNLMQVDLQKYNEKRVTKQPEGQITQNSVSSGTTHVDLTQDTDNPVAGPSASSTGSRSSSRAPKDDTKPSTPTVVPPSASLPSSRPPAAQNIPAQSADANKQLQSEDVEMNATASVLSPAMNDKVNRVLLTLTGSVPSDVAVAEAVDPTTVKSDVPMPSNIKHDLVPPPPDVDADAENTSRERDGSMDMDIDSSQDVPSVAHPADLGTVIQNLVKNINVEELVRNINVEDVVNDVNRHIASNTVDVSLELQEFSTADLPIPKPQEVSLEDAIPSSKTGLDAATVIIHHRGLASGAITMKFSVNQNQMDAITKWNNRLKHTEDLEDSLCLSLLCFAIPDLKTRLESSQSNDLRNLLPELECSWPKNGELNMDALWKGQRMTFPMAPPFALPPSGLTDVSPFLVVGENTLCIKQTRDMSEYWLLLCAHHPTTSQLNAVARRRHKERNWSAWLASISRPLQLPFSVPITAT